MSVDVNDDALLTVNIESQSVNQDSSLSTAFMSLGGAILVRAISIDSSVSIAPLDQEEQVLKDIGDEGRWRFRVSPSEAGHFDIIVSFALENSRSGGHELNSDATVGLDVNGTTSNFVRTVGDWIGSVSDKSAEILVIYGFVLGLTNRKARGFVRRKWRQLRTRLSGGGTGRATG